MRTRPVIAVAALLAASLAAPAAAQLPRGVSRAMSGPSPEVRVASGRVNVSAWAGSSRL